MSGNAKQQPAADHRPPVTGHRQPVLSITDLRLSRGARQVLRGVNIDVAAGELVALMGLSGGGKTTVLRTVSALETFDSGAIDVNGFVLHPGPLPPQTRLRDLRRNVGMVFQLHYLFEHLTALDNVTLAPRHVGHAARSEAEAKAVSLLEARV